MTERVSDNTYEFCIVWHDFSEHCIIKEDMIAQYIVYLPWGGGFVFLTVMVSYTLMIFGHKPMRIFGRTKVRFLFHP